MRNISKLAIFALVLTLFTPMPASAFTGGTVTGIVVLKKSDGPISLKKKIVIPEGASLIVEAGAELKIEHTDWAFQVGGTLSIGGTEGETLVRGNSKRFLQIPETQKNAEVRLTKINGSNLGESEIDGGSIFTMELSKISGASVYSFFYSTAEILVKGNSFFFSDLMDAQGVNDSCKSYGLSFTYPQNSATVANNSFSGGRGSDKLCSSWFSYDRFPNSSTAFIFNDNAFRSPKVLASFVRADLTMIGTFIEGATSDETRHQKVWDQRDDLAIRGAVEFVDSVNQLQANTPQFLTDPANPTNTANPIQFKNCAALNKIYPGGVAKSSNSRNKGGKIRLGQFINSRIYELNKGLDRDRDGLACEK